MCLSNITGSTNDASERSYSLRGWFEEECILIRGAHSLLHQVPAEYWLVCLSEWVVSTRPLTIPLRSGQGAALGFGYLDILLEEVCLAKVAATIIGKTAVASAYTFCT